MAENNESNKLSTEKRNQIAQWLLQRSRNGKCNYGAKKEAANIFKTSERIVYTIWKGAVAQQAAGIPIALKKMKKGSTHKDKWKLDAEKVKNLSVLQRTSIRVMACSLGVSKSLVHNWVKRKELRAHTNSIKPFLTAQNKRMRLQWSLSQLSDVSEMGMRNFQSMFNTIHIDEKWFYLTKTKDRYYLLPDEKEPYRSCKSKRYILKIMFISAIARPIMDEHGNVLFDGKLGIFPLTNEEAAKRNSKNREKGTLEVKPISNITKNIMRECMIDKMLPVFKAKWPAFASKQIFIQQDNAKPHIKPDDPEFLAVANADGFNFQLVCQPPKSPDTNVNDLGFFRAIQTLKDQKPAKDVPELLKNVHEAYKDYPPQKINHVFLTLQGCYHEILKAKGDNNYTIPHMNKERLERAGILPETLQVEEALVQECVEYLEGLQDYGSNEEAAQQSMEDAEMAEIIEGLMHVQLS